VVIGGGIIARRFLLPAACFERWTAYLGEVFKFFFEMFVLFGLGDEVT